MPASARAAWSQSSNGVQRPTGSSCSSVNGLELTDGELPYAAVVSALRPVLHDDVAADVFTAGERQQLSRLWPELGGEAEAGSELDPSNQARVFALLLRLLTALARRRPVVFIVEDLHWADRSTRDFLAFLVRAARG
jgi:predicted ATPase